MAKKQDDKLTNARRKLKEARFHARRDRDAARAALRIFSHLEEFVKDDEVLDDESKERYSFLMEKAILKYKLEVGIHAKRSEVGEWRDGGDSGSDDSRRERGRVDSDILTSR
jgi:hypothetical protein